MNEQIDRMKKELGGERKHVVEFLKLLIHADQVKWHLKDGFSGLLDLCMRELRLSRSTSLKRINAARLAERFPVILDLLQKGRIHLSALTLLSRHLTEDNHTELLGYAETHGEDQIERWLAAKFPKVSKGPKEKLKWLDGDTAQLTLVIDPELWELIERSKELMKHKHPTGEIVPLLKDILKKHLQSIDPLRRKARKASPKKSNVHSRKIPRGIQAQVWKRDEARCSYVSPDGRRCEERAGLEIDHRVAWAHGGRSDDIANARLLCFSHNRWLGIKTFGKNFDSRPRPDRAR